MAGAATGRDQVTRQVGRGLSQAFEWLQAQQCSLLSRRAGKFAISAYEFESSATFAVADDDGIPLVAVVPGARSGLARKSTGVQKAIFSICNEPDRREA